MCIEEARTCFVQQALCSNVIHVEVIVWLSWPCVIHYRSHWCLVIACDGKKVTASRVKPMTRLPSGDRRFCSAFLADYLQRHSRHRKGGGNMISIHFRDLSCVKICSLDT